MGEAGKTICGVFTVLIIGGLTVYTVVHAEPDSRERIVLKLINLLAQDED